MLKKQLLPLPPVGKSIFEIITEVAAKHGFTYTEMLSQRRQASLVRARQEAYWRCAKETVFSLPTIGRHFGNRDHTTIMKGMEAYIRRMQAEVMDAPGAGDAAKAV